MVILTKLITTYCLNFTNYSSTGPEQKLLEKSKKNLCFPVNILFLKRKAPTVQIRKKTKTNQERKRLKEMSQLKKKRQLLSLLMRINLDLPVGLRKMLVENQVIQMDLRKVI